MNCRNVLRYTSLGTAAFGLSRDLFAAQVLPTWQDKEFIRFVKTEMRQVEEALRLS